MRKSSKGITDEFIQFLKALAIIAGDRTMPKTKKDELNTAQALIMKNLGNKHFQDAAKKHYDEIMACLKEENAHEEISDNAYNLVQKSKNR